MAYERPQTPVIVGGIIFFTLLCGLIVSAPKWRLGGCEQDGDAVMLKELNRLRREADFLRTMLSTKEAGVNTETIKSITQQKDGDLVPFNPVLGIDLYSFLSRDHFHAGVSWDVYNCAGAMKDAFPAMTPQQYQSLAKRMKEDLAKAMALARGVSVESALKATSKTWEQMVVKDEAQLANPASMRSVYAAMSRDPAFYKWRTLSALVLSRYFLSAHGIPILGYRCGTSTDTVPNRVMDPDTLGSIDFCPGASDEERLRHFGYLHFPYKSIDFTVDVIMKEGLCTQNSNITYSYAQWLVQERMNKPEWHTFNVPTKEEDQVTFLFDIMYEKHGVFGKQYWMGVVTMQNPFDLYSIQDIIYTVRPDLIIETGTANGGSALMWASIMELNGIQGRIVTMDMAEPSWDSNTVAWGGARPRNNPRDSRLWKKYVTFLKGNTVGAENVDIVRAFASKAERIIVLLDSDHSHWHVEREMEIYCPLVTPGSYCLVEDTKMSRWASIGPLPAVQSYVAKHPEFTPDRSRELLYSHHVYGYLQRSKDVPYEKPHGTNSGIARVAQLLEEKGQQL